jgi:hypothetical protein
MPHWGNGENVARKEFDKHRPNPAGMGRMLMPLQTDIDISG